MKFQSGDLGGICYPVDEEAKGVVRALHAMIKLQDNTFEPIGEFVGPETLVPVNRMGFSFRTCKELTDDIEDVIELVGGAVIDPATGQKMVVKKAGFPWWTLLLAVGGGVAVWNYTRPKGKRWF